VRGFTLLRAGGCGRHGIGNRIQSKQDIPAGIEIGKRIPGVIGLVIVAADQMGVWGAIEVVALDRKKG